MSKDLKPKRRLGQQGSKGKRIAVWSGILAVCVAGVLAAYHYGSDTSNVEVPVQRVRSGDLSITVEARGEIKSENSIVLTAPQVPDLRIVRLATSGKMVKKGDIVVEFDGAQQEQNFIEQKTNVRTADSMILQTEAQQRITNEMDSMNLMTSTFNVQRTKLDASKADVLSAIEGAKNRIDVGVAEGDLSQINATINSHQVAAAAEMNRLKEHKNKTMRDTGRARGYLEKMVLRAPIDGVVNILPNFRSSGSFGSTPPPFKEGDRAWTGASIAEIPDLHKMRLELKMEEVDRGKVRLGAPMTIHVDAVPDKEFRATINWISPIAELTFRGFGPPAKLFPAYATLDRVDPRLRPGMTGSATILIRTIRAKAMIPLRASFFSNGQPAVYVQKGHEFQLHAIKVGERNDKDLIVTEGLKEGDIVALENPVEAAKRAKKL
jgi:multidrug efflux pump subunit AcrA (membrane-fusion protein)